MLFNSMTFAVFLLAVFILYHIVPVRFRWVFLLAASYAFYMNLHAAYGLLLLFTTILTYFLALELEKTPAQAKRKLCLLGGVLPLVAVLLLFKLGAPVIGRINALIDAGRLALQPLTMKILLPAGVSFYFFQSMGYLIDVYKGKIRAERHFGYYALFVSFFPQLLAGPIGRADALLPQLKKERRFDYESVTYGLKLMAWGYFKKLVIADVFATTVNKVYDNAHSYVGLVFIIVTVMFAIEIYCDFSGYSDIAIGCAKLFGIELATNFKSPYLSFSIKEFWSRWHISLSTWFRDYVYIPLGGSRCSRGRNIFNLAVVWLLTGFWHGANWTFVLWGGWFLLLLLGEKFLWGNALERLPAPLRHVYTMLAVILSWVLFRAPDLSAAFSYLAAMFGLGAGARDGQAVYLLLEYWPEWIACIIAAMPVKGWFQDKLAGREALPAALAREWAPKLVALALLGLSYLKLATGSFNPFIYFQF